MIKNIFIKFITIMCLLFLSASSFVSARQINKFYMFPNACYQSGWGSDAGNTYKLTNIERQNVSADLGYYPFKKLGFFYQLGISPSVISMSNMGAGILRSENQVLLAKPALCQLYFYGTG